MATIYQNLSEVKEFQWTVSCMALSCSMYTGTDE